MGNKRGPRNIGPEKYLKVWQFGTASEIYEATLKEASRQITELENWAKEHKKYDPWGMADYYEEDGLFKMVAAAKKYRYRIYDITKTRKELEAKQHEISALRYGGKYGADWFADPEVAGLKYDHNEAETDQMALAWRIKKIHTIIKHRVRMDISPGETDPFAEYEYDPETS